MTIGHLDQEGVDILDRKLKENLSIEEIIKFFSNYKPKILQLKISKSKGSLETISREFSSIESFTLDNENNTKTDQKQTLDHDANGCNLTLNSFSKIEDEKEEGIGDILSEGTSVDNIVDISVTVVDVQTKQKENFEKETNAKSKSLKKKRNVFDVLDVEHLKNNIPFMHPDRKTHTFRFFIPVCFNRSQSPPGQFLDTFSTEFMRFVGAWGRR